MSGKNQYPNIYNWQASSPVTGFLPTHSPGGSIPSGVSAGVMASTNVIYSNIIDLAKMDNIGLEITWTGTAVGVLEIMGSNSGITFYALTFNPALAQPAGSASGYLIDLSGYPFKYIMLKYTNTSGAGTLKAYGQNKDLN